ncbi:MAG: bile acid:sodium symporter family protein [Polyangiaceae bacterium]
MEESFTTKVLLPVALGIIMLGLGLSLTIDDFKRVTKIPRAILVGLVCQMGILPFACYGIAKLFNLSPEFAVGLMLLAASPGGATANLFSHLAKGDVALNITLTAINSLLSLATLPFIVNFSLEAFMGEGKVIPLQLKEILQVFAIVLVPVGIGMAIRLKKTALALRLERPVRITSALFLAAIVVASILKQRADLPEMAKSVGPAALVFNLTSMAVGYVVPRLARLPKRQSVAIGMEIGIHNGTLAIAIASGATLLNNPRMAVPAAIYSLVMFVTAAIFATVFARASAVEER